MDNDFNTAQAVAALFDLARDINRYEGEGTDAAEARETLMELGGVLALTFQEPELEDIDIDSLQQLLISINEWLRIADLHEILIDKIPSDVEALMELITSSRSGLRDKQLWEYADKIRNRLIELNIALEDTVEGTEWRRKR